MTFFPPSAKRILCLTLCLPSAVALAATELVLQLDSSVRTDSNPLRFAQDVDVKAAIGTDKTRDTIAQNQIKGAVVIPLDSPETRLVMTGLLGRLNYNQLAPLDTTEYAYSAALEWRFGPLWKGKLLHSQAQQLYAYRDGSLTSKEQTHESTTRAEVSLRMTPDIELPVAVQHKTSRYELPVNAPFDGNTQTMDAAIRMTTGMQSRVQAGIRTTRTTFTQRTADQIATLDNHFRDDELYLESVWAYSVMTQFSGRVSALHRSYNVLASRDFSAMPIELSVVHNYSPLTKLTLEAWNRYYGGLDAATLYSRATGAQLGVRWQASVKTRVSAQLLQESLRNQSVTLQTGVVNPEFNRMRWGGGVVYALTPETRVYADGFKERYTRGAFGPDILQNTLRVGLEYTFENIPNIAMRNGLGDRF